MEASHPRFPAFEALIYDLLSESPRPFVQTFETDSVELAFQSGARALILRYTPERREQLIDEARAAMKRGVGEVVLVGGPAEARAILQKARPFYTPSAVLAYHLPDHGETWSSKRAMIVPPVGKRLQQGIVGPADGNAWNALMEAVSADRQVVQAEAQAFAAALGSRRPVATVALIGIIAAMFLLEVMLGGAEQTRVLVRLGALVPSRVAHEPWRLFSSAFLHASYMHVLLNTYVLWIIGSTIERVLGSYRFLVVFFLAVLGGSIASLVAGSATVTVGASGGLWGLLAAEAVLVYRPRGLLPQVMLPRARRAAMTNLVINIVNSLRPHVSMSAHFGGGLVGALLLLPDFFIAGLPKLGEAVAPRREVNPLWLRALALVGALVLVGSVGAAVVTSGALKQGPPKLASITVGSSKVSLSLPEGLAVSMSKEATDANGKMSSVMYGDLMEDPIAYSVTVYDFTTPIAEAAMPAEQEGLKQTMAKDEEGFVVEGPPTARRIGAHDGLVTQLRQADKAGRFVVQRAGYLSAQRMVIIEAIGWKDDPQTAGAAERALASVVER